MKRLHYIVFFFLILTGISSCKKDSDYYHIRISGKVIDAKTNLPVVDAGIHRYYNVFGPSLAEAYTVTDGNGNFSFYGDTDVDGNFTFVVRKYPGYNAYAPGLFYKMNSKTDISNLNIQLYPDTYISFIITKTTIADSSILVTYYNEYPVNISKTVSNSSSPDTLTILGSALKNNLFKFNVRRYNTNPPTGTPTSDTPFEYNINPGVSDTTFYPVSY